MTVYVDEPIHAYRGMIMCHMTSPDLGELHAMADRIGVQRRWFQDPLGPGNVSRPHYDIAKSKRGLAVAAGAREINRYQMVVVSNVAMHRYLIALDHPAADRFADPLRLFRKGPRFAEMEAWFESEFSAA